MSDILKQTKEELEKCRNTDDVRKLSAKLFRKISDKSKENGFNGVFYQ